MAEIDKIGIEDFFQERQTLPVIDVRTPSEYAKAHIPGAFNIPLFTDEERAVVGTKYVREGRYPAIITGLEAVGPKLTRYLEQLKSITGSNRKVLVYCWRGGMRSASMTWLFNLAGYKARALEGGYKSYRRLAHRHFEQKLKLVVLGGMTGSGKTELLTILKEKGEQVIDLERLANHKGSAFGWIGQKKQPSTEQFENLLFEELIQLDASQPIWVEDESKSIGTVFVPQPFHRQMAEAKCISIEVSDQSRLDRLMRDYTDCPKEHLITSLQKIAKRLGPENSKHAIELVESGNYREAIAISLRYYDKAYRYGLENKKTPPKKIKLGDEIEENIRLLIRAKKALFGHE